MLEGVQIRALIVISKSKVLVGLEPEQRGSSEIEVIYSSPSGNPLNRLTFSKYSNDII
jgi:hypothetical protein